MSFSGSLIVGIMSGIVTSAILCGIATAFKRIVLPWYQGLIYKGIHVEGEWHTYEDATKKSIIAQMIKMDLSQQAALIVGIATMILPEESELPIERVRTFEVRGNIENRFVQLVLTHLNRNRIRLQSMLLQVESDGRMIRGVASFYNTGESVLNATNIAFARPDAIEAISRYNQKKIERKKRLEAAAEKQKKQ